MWICNCRRSLIGVMSLWFLQWSVACASIARCQSSSFKTFPHCSQYVGRRLHQQWQTIGRAQLSASSRVYIYEVDIVTVSLVTMNLCYLGSFMLLLSLLFSHYCDNRVFTVYMLMGHLVFFTTRECTVVIFSVMSVCVCLSCLALDFESLDQKLHYDVQVHLQNM